MTKLYEYLDKWQDDLGTALGWLILVQLIILGLVGWILFHPFDWQELHTAIDTARINIREDVEHLNNLSAWYSNQITSLHDKVDNLQWRTNWIADNIKPSHSWVTNISNIQLVHYIAEVEICSDKHPSYKVKVDFYWINPRIESSRLLILDERLFSNYEAYNVYLPVYDKNTDYDANLCSIKIISSSNK